MSTYRLTEVARTQLVTAIDMYLQHELQYEIQDRIAQMRVAEMFESQQTIDEMEGDIRALEEGAEELEALGKAINVGKVQISGEAVELSTELGVPEQQPEPEVAAETAKPAPLGAA